MIREVVKLTLVGLGCALMILVGAFAAFLVANVTVEWQEPARQAATKKTSRPPCQQCDCQCLQGGGCTCVDLKK